MTRAYKNKPLENLYHMQQQRAEEEARKRRYEDVQISGHPFTGRTIGRSVFAEDPARPGPDETVQRGALTLVDSLSMLQEYPVTQEFTDMARRLREAMGTVGLQSISLGSVSRRREGVQVGAGVDYSSLEQRVLANAETLRREGMGLHATRAAATAVLQSLARSNPTGRMSVSPTVEQDITVRPRDSINWLIGGRRHLNTAVQGASSDLHDAMVFALLSAEKGEGEAPKEHPNAGEVVKTVRRFSRTVGGESAQLVRQKDGSVARKAVESSHNDSTGDSTNASN